jgi:type I restriction enzyme S subunit
MLNRRRASVPDGWKVCRLGEITSRITQRNSSRNTNVLTASAKHGLVSQESYFQKRVASEDTRPYFLLRRGDFVYTKSYSDGYPAGVTRRLTLYDSGIVTPLYICFRSLPEVMDPRFLEHYFESGIPDDDILGIAKEGARNHGLLNVGVDDFFSLPIVAPPLREQQRIAEILDTAGGEIDRTALSLAKVGITKWSVWQDLHARVEAPSVKLGQLLSEDPRNGYSPVEAVETTGVFALGLGCLTPNGFAPAQLKPIPARDPTIKRALLSNGDLLISRSNTRELVGAVGRYRNIGFPCIYPDLMMRLRPTEDILPEFLELSLRSGPLRRQIQAAAQGTSGSMVKISAATVRTLSLKLPRPDEQDRILRAAQPWDETLANLEVRLEKLRLVKKGLMDDLLSGRVRVGAA